MRFFVCNFEMAIIFMIIYISKGEECGEKETVCRFSLVIEPKLTMMINKTRVRPCGGRLCIWNTTASLESNIEDEIITMDGVHARIVFSVNGKVPGPELIVYEDQKIEVMVTNKLHTESVAIHFHGQHQKGSPYMDGVAYITQCPIHPGLTFKYVFTAKPHGTHWYHAHIGDQRSMGVYGPFIVKRKHEPSEYIDKHIITIQDWNHDMNHETAYLKMLSGIYNCNLDGTRCTPYSTTHSVDKGRFSVFEFQSGLINGRGRYYINGMKNKHNNAPLTTYTVEKGKRYRFRVISAATLYPFRLYVAGHKMTIVASDGRELEPIEVESFIIHTGERIDFILNASLNLGDYMIVAETLEVLSKDKHHVAEAVLHYNGYISQGAQISTQVSCEGFPEGRCPVFNCPFLYFHADTQKKCITFHEASATLNEITADHNDIISPKADKTFFLNFAFPGPPGNTPGSVNGHQFLSPTVSAYSQPDELASLTCDKKECGPEKICECMYSININNDEIIDLIFMDMGTGRGWSHPIHLHGHSFYVAAMGFPVYHTDTGRFKEENKAIECIGRYCNYAKWAGRHRMKRQSGSTYQTRIPPLKDTIVVPNGGYVITRFKADNPGVWFLHCHIDLHNTNGMAMVVNESFNRQVKPPKAMPRCRDYLHLNDVQPATSNAKGVSASLPLGSLLLCINIFATSVLIDQYKIGAPGRNMKWVMHKDGLMCS